MTPQFHSGQRVRRSDASRAGVPQRSHNFFGRQFRLPRGTGGPIAAKSKSQIRKIRNFKKFKIAKIKF